MADFVEVFVGRGAARVRDLFEKAEQSAPCILFFDELDALAKSRTGGGFGNDEREQTLNQLLTEMDGFDSALWGAEPSASKKGNSNGNAPGGPIVVIAATNRPDVLDSALLRPGRFDRHVRVGLPSEQGRLEILRVHIKSRNVPVDDDVCLEHIAQETLLFSGADLSNVVNEAALLAIRAGREKVNFDDFQSATEKCKNMNAVE